MPKIIDHNKRKGEILFQALQVFAQHGYMDTNLSMIAKACMISRPTIYQYFHDKEEIFRFAVKKVTGEMFTKYVSIAFQLDRPVAQRLKEICSDIVTQGYENRDKLTALADVMVQRKRQGGDFSDIIMKRTVKLNILFKRMLRYGIDGGEFREIPINEVSTQLFTLLESMAFQMALMDQFDPKSSINLVNIFIDHLGKTHPD